MAALIDPNAVAARGEQPWIETVEIALFAGAAAAAAWLRIGM
ncbi:MAG TPA: hypothetical protein VM261_30625 [Kofleriaceae bacterium]|nr:hypothetical protein [Kofleriaceae bacterium]